MSYYEEFPFTECSSHFRVCELCVKKSNKKVGTFGPLKLTPWPELQRVARAVEGALRERQISGEIIGVRVPKSALYVGVVIGFDPDSLISIKST
jgi:hypothetical protein